ncbi:MAG: DUF5991 domain-containing protein [Thermoleophilia bacterium]
MPGAYGWTQDLGTTVGGTPIIIQHRLQVRAAAAGAASLRGVLRSDGFQTRARLRVRLEPTDRFVDVRFVSYGDGKAVNPFGIAEYRRGELLFSLSGSLRNLRTRVYDWNVDVHARRGAYFRCVSAPRSALTQPAAAEQVLLALAPGGLQLVTVPGEHITQLPYGGRLGQVVHGVSAARGAPVAVAHRSACPPGPLTLVRYRGGLTVVGRGRRFVGWQLDGRSHSKLTTVSGVGIGSTLAAVRGVYADVTVQHTSLGWEFTTAGTLHGTLSGRRGQVTNLWDGTTCVSH